MKANKETSQANTKATERMNELSIDLINHQFPF
jgi:hypothetical protein